MAAVLLTLFFLFIVITVASIRESSLLVSVSPKPDEVIPINHGRDAVKDFSEAIKANSLPEQKEEVRKLLTGRWGNPASIETLVSETKKVFHRIWYTVGDVHSQEFFNQHARECQKWSGIRMMGVPGPADEDAEGNHIIKVGTSEIPADNTHIIYTASTHCMDEIGGGEDTDYQAQTRVYVDHAVFKIAIYKEKKEVELVLEFKQPDSPLLEFAQVRGGRPMDE